MRSVFVRVPLPTETSRAIPREMLTCQSGEVLEGVVGQWDSGVVNVTRTRALIV